MKLVVCGCSWSSRDPNNPDTEFGYFVSKHFGWDYKNIARVSSDNYAIRYQIDHAIDVLKADIIIVNWTTACRITWNNTGKRFVPSNGLKQLNYDVDSFCRNDNTHPCWPDIDPVIMSHSIPSIVDFEQGSMDYDNLVERNPIVKKFIGKEQWETFNRYYLHMYDDDLEAHKQYYMMESAVAKMQRHGVKFLFCPNTFNFMHSYMMSKGMNLEEHTEEVHRDRVDDLYVDWPCVPEENLVRDGIALALQWDFTQMDDPINHPNHNNCHHLSAWAQEQWANRVAIPNLTRLLSK